MAKIRLFAPLFLPIFCKKFRTPRPHGVRGPSAPSGSPFCSVRMQALLTDLFNFCQGHKARQKCNFVTCNFVTFWCFQKVQTKFIINIYIIIYILIILYTLIIKLLFLLSYPFPTLFPFLPIKNRQKVTSYKVTSLYSKINVRVGRDALLYAPFIALTAMRWMVEGLAWMR